MALSEFVKEGQIPICCDLCETKTKISWKCLDCILFLCHRCKELTHSKFKGAGNHMIVDIKEAGLYIEKPDFSNMKCIEHKDQDCFMFCKSCDQLVCPQCIPKTHTYGHELVQISEGYVIQFQRLKNGQDEMKNKIDRLEKKETKINDIKKSENEKYKDAEKKIQTQQILLHEAVDKYIEKLLKELDQHRETLMDSIEKEESKMITSKKITTNSNTLLEDVICSNDPEKIFQTSKELDKHLEEEEDSLELNVPTMPIFLQGEITQYNVGSLQNTADITCRVVKEYTTDISQVFYLTPCFDSLCISNGKVLQQVQPEVNNLKVISSFDIPVYGIAITPCNDLLLASDESVIKQISGSTGQLQDSIYHTEQLQPTAIHITSDYKVFVGVKNFGKVFPVTGRRAAISMDEEGKHKTIYEYDRNNQSIFTYPESITSTQNGNICVVDKLTSDAGGRVVVLGYEGDILNIYTGHPDINTEGKPFKPKSIETTPSDNIIVPDMDTHTLHLLNNVGQLITHINIGDIGILCPYSITFTSTGKVYIGCTGKKDKAKLYEVNTTGF